MTLFHGKYNLNFDRLKGAWEDFRDLDLEYHPEMPEELRQRVRAYILSLPVDARPMIRVADQAPAIDLEQGTPLYNEARRTEHSQLFPFHDIIQTLFFVIQSDLSSENLRILLQRSVYEGRTIKTWDMDFLRRVFIKT